MDLDWNTHFLLCSLLFYLKFYTMKGLFLWGFFGIFKRQLKLLPLTLPSLLIHFLPKWNLLPRENGPTFICFLFVCFCSVPSANEVFFPIPFKKMFLILQGMSHLKNHFLNSVLPSVQSHGISLSLHMHRILYIF